MISQRLKILKFLKCNLNFESLRINQELKLDTFSKHIIYKRLNKSLGEDDLLLKKNIEFYFKCIEDKKMSKSEASRKLHCSRQWLTELYNRYIKGENLEKKRGHKRKALSIKMQDSLFNLYKDLSYQQNGLLLTPSMEVLKSIAIEQIQNFPDIHIQTIRDYLKQNRRYPKKIKSKKYRKRFEAKFVGELIQGDVSTYQYLVPKYQKYSLANFEVEVRENPDKWIKLFYKDNLLTK